MAQSKLKRVIFDVQSIQNWIGAGGKLVDLAGGSEILEQLVNSDFRRALHAIDGKDAVIESNAAGRFSFVADEHITSLFCKLWPLITAKRAPGLRYGLKAFSLDEGHRVMSSELASDAALRRPGDGLATPLTDRAPRTGGPAISNEDSERLDQGLAARRSIGKPLRERSTDGIEGALQKKFEVQGAVFLKDADELAAYGPSRYLAYIHADGSGVGAIVSELRQRPPQEMAEFSRKLDIATCAATRSALQSLDLAELPLRPVLLGGDDLSLVLPGHLGLDFTTAFLEAFEEQTKKHLSKWQIEGLKAGAGIAYVHAHFPSESAFALAGNLCDWAKKEVDRQASALAFHRVTTSGSDNYENAILANELTRGDVKSGDRLTSGPYVIADGCCVNLPSRDDPANEKSFLTTEAIERLLSASQKLPNGPLRKTLSLAHVSRSAAAHRFRRIAEVATDHRRGGSSFDEFAGVLSECGFTSGDDASVWRELRGPHVTPVGDLHALLSVEGKGAQ